MNPQFKDGYPFSFHCAHVLIAPIHCAYDSGRRGTNSAALRGRAAGAARCPPHPITTDSGPPPSPQVRPTAHPPPHLSPHAPARANVNRAEKVGLADAEGPVERALLPEQYLVVCLVAEVGGTALQQHDRVWRDARRAQLRDEPRPVVRVQAHVDRRRLHRWFDCVRRSDTGGASRREGGERTACG